MAIGPTTPKMLIELVIQAKISSVVSYGAFEISLQRKLGCELDYMRRLLNGTRPLRETHRNIIKTILGTPHLDFDSSPRDLALKLGLSRREAEGLLGSGIGGFDFAARTNDRRSVQQLFEIIGGYWELVFWSFSRLDEQVVSRELCIIDGIDEGNFITCRIIDVNFTYSGVVFPVLNHLYFLVEKDKLFDEVVVYLTNRPERAPPVLRGISLGLSGGVEDIHSHPTASKAAFRFIGRDVGQVRERYPQVPPDPQAIEEHLARAIVRYMSKAEVDALSPDEIARLQISRIDNHVPANAVPFVLQSAK